MRIRDGNEILLVVMKFFFDTSLSLSLHHGFGLDIIHSRSFKRSDTFFSETFTFIFDKERVLLQPANSLLQPAKKVRLLTKFYFSRRDINADRLLRNTVGEPKTSLVNQIHT